MNAKPFIFLLFLFLIGSCQEKEETNDSASQTGNHFSDSTLVEIHQLQDERKARELVKYFSSENERYRREAAMSMASVQDPETISYLAILLDDQHPGVRSAAAYALGQMYDSAALQPLVTALQEEDSVHVTREIIESIGKVVTQDSVDILNGINAETDAQREGLAWGLYRAGIRNVHDPLFVQRALSLLDTGNTYQTRLGAAHFLSRTPNIQLDNYLTALRKNASIDQAPSVRMALALAIGKISTENAFRFLTDNLLNDTDYRVRVNVLRAMGGHPSRTVQDTTYFIRSLEDENINVQVAAAEILSGQEGLEPGQMLAMAEAHPDARVKGLLYASAIRNSEEYTEAIEKIKEEYNASDDRYYKSALLGSLGYTPLAYDFIVTEIFSGGAPVIATAGVSALITMRGLENFPSSLEQPLAEVMKDVMRSGDIGMVYLGAQLLSDDRYGFRAIYDDISFLHESKEKLSLPKDNEALQVLNTTIAYFEGAEEMPETTNPYNHPIDWEFVKSIPENAEVKIETTKGVITMRMRLKESPGSVANFMELAGSGYYNNIAFHRVVPNFVVQGGCPRGDGFGGEDYSIRSELSDLRYGEGAVGMASAGKDTEGTQWFITHSPTPHLDGRYTIFAQVISGMDVVHQMEVGDRILNISLPEL